MPLIETRGAGSAQGFGEFAQSAAVNYIEDVFSTYLYTGNGSTQTITNGIDVTGKGGMIWFKERASQGFSHALIDTARGNSSPTEALSLASDNTNSQSSVAAVPTSSGFSLSGPGSAGPVNYNGSTYASWTFRKQKKFFDIVTYTGDGNTSKTIPHNLGSVPGCIITKMTSGVNNWQTYHRSLGNTQAVQLNLTNAASTNTGFWNNTSPTATDFTVGTVENASGETYVAYLFAHDAGGFGLSGSDNVISCGSFVGNNSTPVSVTLGWETQWLLVRATNGNNWYMFDTMRGFVASPGTSSKALYPNLPDVEASWNLVVEPTATGFSFTTNNTSTWIYIAIRRGPMKVPTSGTSVFSPDKTNAASGTIVTTNVNSDLFVVKYLDGVDIPRWHDRLRGYANNVGDASPLLRSSGTDAEVTGATGAIASVTNIGFKVTGTLGGLNSVYYSFRRAPGFFDVVCYTGDGTGTQLLNHNLTVNPELVIIKRRDSTSDWMTTTLSNGSIVYSVGLNSTSADNATNFQGTAYSTATQFGVRTGTTLANISGATYVAYLFATVAGVSKVGTYTGTGTTKQIDCGFTGGARFVLIKRTDSTGDWYVWDTARGIVASTDPYLVLNSTAAEVTTTDWVDTYSAGFELSSAAGNNVNINAASYIFLSIS